MYGYIAHDRSLLALPDLVLALRVTGRTAVLVANLGFLHWRWRYWR